MRRKRLVPGVAALLVALVAYEAALQRGPDPSAEAAARGKGVGVDGGPVTQPAPPTAPTAASAPRGASSEMASVARRGPSRADVAREAFTGQVVGVSDGDTVSVLRGSPAAGGAAVETAKVRLDGVDCPELRQPYGRRAKELTSRLVFGKDVRVEVRDVDRYSRLVARVVLPDGRDLSEELVRSGLAWWYRKYSKDPELEALETEARTARRGLWADPAAARTPPWDYRAAAKAR